MPHTEGGSRCTFVRWGAGAGRGTALGGSLTAGSLTQCPPEGLPGRCLPAKAQEGMYVSPMSVPLTMSQLTFAQGPRLPPRPPGVHGLEILPRLATAFSK